MISRSFQLILIAVTSINIIVNVVYIKRGEMRVKYSLIWLTLSLVLLLLAIFPGTLMSFAKLLNISSDTNALFMFFIGFLYIISFSFSIMFSRNSKKITMLAQQIGISDNKIVELENQIINSTEDTNN